MEQHELIELYAKESLYTLYQSGIIHGLFSELCDAYSDCGAQGEYLSVEFFDLEDYLTQGLSNEDAIALAIRRRLMNSFEPNEFGTYSSFGEPSPPLSKLKKSVENGSLTVTHIADGGIADALFRTVPPEHRHRLQAQDYSERMDKLKHAIDFIFADNGMVDNGMLEYELAISGKQRFKDAPRYKVKVDMEAAQYHLMFSWTVLDIQAVVCGNNCLMFVFANCE